MHALTGSFVSSAIKVDGMVGTKQIHILIDYGSTHNFLDLNTAKRLGCNCVQLLELNFIVANGQTMCLKFACPKFKWSLQGHLHTTNVLLLPLENYDLILGAHCLAIFDDVIMNFKQLYLKFVDAGTMRMIQGNSDSTVQFTSASKLEKILQKGTCSYSLVQHCGGCK